MKTETIGQEEREMNKTDTAKIVKIQVLSLELIGSTTLASNKASNEDWLDLMDERAQCVSIATAAGVPAKDIRRAIAIARNRS